MEKKVNTKNIIIIVGSIAVIIASILLIIFSQKSDDNKGNNEIIEKDTYKTKDNRYTLKIVEESNEEAYNNAKSRYGEDNFDEVIKPNIKLYAYLNNRVFVIDEVFEDENYGLYSFVGLPDEEFGHKILINKTNHSIEASDEDLQNVKNNCLSSGFCGFQEQPGYVKGNSGYYFYNNNKGLVTIYTTEWKKIGYVDKVANIQLDVDGNVMAYNEVQKDNCNGDYCTYTGVGELQKFDTSGARK